MRDQLVGDVTKAGNDDNRRPTRGRADSRGARGCDDVDAAAEQRIDRSDSGGNVDEIALQSVLLE